MEVLEVPTAFKMAEQIDYLAGQLQDKQLITPASRKILADVASTLKPKGKSRCWSYLIGSSKLIEFVHTKQEANNYFIPRLSAHISVNDANGSSPFDALNITLEIVNLNKQPISRWHIDQANDNQLGPLFHLQGGGHWAGRTERENELPVKLPRWLYPPMDLVLAIEMVIANFFPNKWNECFRNNQAWIALIKDSQKLCFKAYMDKMKSSEHTSYLAAMWGDKWH